jgi:hypothetical protein
VSRLAVVVAAACVAAVLASASAAGAATTRVNCSKKDVTVFFWPHGHHSIPSLGFPEFLLPHLEVYRSGSAYPNANELALVQADGGTAYSRTCAPTGQRRATRFDERPKKTTRATALRCRARQSSKLELSDEPGKSGTLRVWYGRKLGAVAKMAPSGSKLSFDRGYCKPFAP